MDYIQKMLIAFAWKLDEYYSGDEHPEHIEKLVEDFLTEYKPYDQPERSKREDSSCCSRVYVEYAPEFGIPSGWENLKQDGMRCSEHCGDTVREVQ